MTPMTTVHDAFSQVKVLLASDPAEALRTALAIKLPSARGYALAWIIRWGNDGIAVQAIKHAEITARTCGDAFCKAIALADPIRAAFGRGKHKQARRMLDEALSRLPAMPTSSEQAEALRLLFIAAFPGGRESWSLLVGHLIDRCPAHLHWRAARAHLRVLRALKDEDRALAEKLVSAMTPGKIERRARRTLNGQRTSGSPAAVVLARSIRSKEEL